MSSSLLGVHAKVKDWYAVFRGLELTNGRADGHSRNHLLLSHAALFAACACIRFSCHRYRENSRWLYFRYRKLQELGLGDVKLVAASAVWIGVAGVPVQRSGSEGHLCR